MDISQDLIGCRVMDTDYEVPRELGIIVGTKNKADSEYLRFIILEEDGNIRVRDNNSYNFSIHPDDLSLLRKNLRATMERRAKMKEQEQITREQLIDMEE